MRIEPSDHESIDMLTERMLADCGHGPFHLSDGVYVWRDRDGIHIGIAEGINRRVMRHFVFDRSSWASAVAATTIEGETGTTFRIADALIG